MIEFLQEIVRAGGDVGLKYFGRELKINTKSNIADLVTEADHAVDQFLVDKILERFPSHQITTEERKESINPGAEYEWIIDPIDGTRNFAHRIPIWCTMIGVLKNGAPHIAAVYAPCVNDLFLAERGKGATRNGLPISVGKIDSLDHGFGFLIHDHIGVHVEKFHQASERFFRLRGWNHNHGTMLAACHIATGGVHFMCNNVGFTHDYVAPALICEEAGAKVTNIDGKPWSRGMRDIVLASPDIHQQVLDLFE